MHPRHPRLRLTPQPHIKLRMMIRRRRNPDLQRLLLAFTRHWQRHTGYLLCLFRAPPGLLNGLKVLTNEAGGGFPSRGISARPLEFLDLGHAHDSAQVVMFGFALAAVRDRRLKLAAIQPYS